MSDEKVMARCMRCKENKEMKGGEESTMKNGGTMLKGVCADCGCKMCKILGKKNKDTDSKLQ